MNRPCLITILETIGHVVEYETWLANGNTPRLRGGPSKTTRMKCHTILYDLPYFEIQLLCVQLPKLTNFRFPNFWCILFFCCGPSVVEHYVDLAIYH
jgi:hypothetical protein